MHALVLPDTNFLLEFPKVHEEKWLLRPVEIIISEVVLSELNGLTRSESRLLAQKASAALATLNQLKIQAERGQQSYQDGQVKLIFVDRPKQISSLLNGSVPDHQLIATALSYLTAEPPHFCAILTDDRALSDIASILAVPVVMPTNDFNLHRFHEQLKRRYEFWVIVKTQSDQPKKKAATPTDRSKGNQEEKGLAKTAGHLHNQIVTAHHRAILAIAPQTARLALTCRLLQSVRDPDKRVMLIFVPSPATAVHWAAVIRQRCGYKVEETPIFGVDMLDPPEKVRAIIYYHGQIGRRIPRQLDRLRLAEQQVTAILDGCELLSPVDMATLLYDCDQIIGFNHYPTSFARTPGNRMLNTFLRNHLLVTYSFADAVRDRWGHDFILFRHEVNFAADEKELWDRVAQEYVLTHQRAVKRRPQLIEAADFWEDLLRVMEHSAFAEAGILLEKRERQEELAQMARGKVDKVKELCRPAPKSPYRRLILDFHRQWTPVLLQQLPEIGLRVAELPAEGDPRPVWDRFAGNQVDTLIFSDLPPTGLPKAYYYQLIILTPLRPLGEISAVVDWALTHTEARESLRVDLLFTRQMPEESAVLELAEAVFDLRYTANL